MSVTVTGTWVPVGSLATDPIPSTIVSVATNAGSSGSSGSPLVQAANDGYGDPTGVATSTGTHYFLQTTSPFTVPLSLTASVSATSTATSAAVAGVSLGLIKITTSVPSISLSGTTPDANGDGKLNILVGQQCTSSLSGIPMGCIVSNYVWGVTGTTFQSWTVSTNALQSTTTEVDGPGRSDQPTARWYWNDNLGSGNNRVEYVTCTATATPPTGQGASFSVTATTQITVWVPSWTASGTGGSVYVVSSPDGTYSLRAAAIPGTSNSGGMDWLAQVVAPDPMFGNGVVAVVQTVIPGFTYQDGGGYYYKPSNYGEEGLDTQYPYKAAAALWMAFDAPSLPLTALDAVKGTNQNQFEDFLMYTPPGSSQCVCIAQFVWSTDGSAVEPSVNGVYSWGFYGSGSAGPVSPSGTGQNSRFVLTNAYPNWTQNSGNGTGPWVVGDP